MINHLIIAEIGSVHDGSFGNACKLVELAARCGANVVKFQTHIADAETLRNAPSPKYFSDESRYQYFNRTSFSLEQWKKIIILCNNVGIKFLSSPFSREALDLLEYIDAQAFKVPSGEVSNLPLIERLAEIGKPVFLSSGMSSWEELDLAVKILRGRVQLSIMQCTSAYPCPLELVGLNNFEQIRERYGHDIILGFSDHTTSISAGVAAAVLGATVIEKHLTFSRAMYGSDAVNAMEPHDFSTYCTAIREAWTMLAHPVDKNCVVSSLEMKLIFEKSIVAAEDLPEGTVISFNHMAFKKPGDGIPASHYREYIGRRIKNPLKADHKFSEDDFE